MSLLFKATQAMSELLESLKQGQTPDTATTSTVTFGQFTDLIGLPAIQALEKRYGVNA